MSLGAGAVVLHRLSGGATIRPLFWKTPRELPAETPPMNLPPRSAEPSDSGRDRSAQNRTGREWDPVFLHSRREAIVIFCVWLAGLLWAVPYCYVNGYAGNIDPENVSTLWGIPSWLFWGIAVPWLVADVVTIWFCFCYMQDDDLGEAREGADVAEDLASERPGGAVVGGREVHR